MPRQPLPDIDDRRCTNCGDCLRVCPTDCLSLRPDGHVIVSPPWCISCEICQTVCPVEAIAMRVQDW
ncbi:MAG: 4Fe-4S dicluster domain-containing protein [Planctomycetales bacterium]|nr:4Fe-4S dicluster domain-containing protein [Planctomycetales bacterium]